MNDTAMQIQPDPIAAADRALEPILALDGITKTFPGVKALSEVELKLYPGQVTALVGENGAGKSTVVKILTGIYQPDGGAIRIDGEAIQFPTAQDAADAGITAIGAGRKQLDGQRLVERVNHLCRAALGYLVELVAEWRPEFAEDLFPIQIARSDGVELVFGRLVEAQEAVQETVITASKNLKDFKTDPARGSFKAWLLKTQPNTGFPFWSKNRFLAFSFIFDQ